MIRVGVGYDVHPLIEGRPLVLGGVRISYPRGLAGHSDSDVVAHAIIDSLLGAAGLGDIGQRFPPTDPNLKNADSLGFVVETARLLRASQWSITNIDVTILAQEPRLAPHLLEMREILSRALGVEIERVSLKGKTTNGLGFEGRGEGIAAHAVALIETQADAR
ncbi:MAG: 2-C-methyl-D-erythritol 2,4-cyclodiphosphate synthase [Dehalococcoidia bacterium]|nr:2-C-methyl-D-erythritol 2,4-cyclodiphosphate synthase [Dehalococcoidia bacterium]